MNLKTLREQQCRILDQRIEALGRIRHGIQYTRSHLSLPLGTTAGLDDATLETLAAFNERFGKLQDILAAAMKQAVLLSGAQAETFPQVLSFMSKAGVVEDMETWRDLRLLRNIGAHEYDLDPARQAEYFSALAEAQPTLEIIADRLIAYCQARLDCR